MSALLDDISRIIASPIPRRKALRLLSGVVGGGVLAYLGLGRASRGLGASVTCPRDKPVPCNGECYPAGYSCCGSAVCNRGQLCIGGNCCPSAQACFGKCCPSGQMCVNGKCCPSAQACFGKCCPSGQTCCNGFQCCPSGQCCHHNTTCCPPHETCCGDRCVGRTPSGSSPCLG
jgi:hypothetical protein